MTVSNIDSIMEEANAAFSVFRKLSLKTRANFMRTIAQEIEALGDELLVVAGQETNLPEARLRGERGRTMFQLNAYADACERGNWLEASIDTAIPDKMPPKPDLRKMLVPLGPVVVFGSSNFPFAYSTAGGDTASAFAAGCPVVVKAHPAHLKTGALMAKAINKAIAICDLPKGVFANVYSPGFEIGKSLVMHKYTAAVGFTGSFSGGKQLYDWANERQSPIPVFAEMTSINPIFLLAEKLQQSAVELAKQIAGSITLGVGQFCTKPGIIIGIEGADLQIFVATLANEIKNIVPATMLHAGIAKAYSEKSEIALAQADVVLVSKAAAEANENQGLATVATINAAGFLANPMLHQEVFGPYSLVISCKDLDEMQQVAQSLEGQLTLTMMATENDIKNSSTLVAVAETLCGRFILNNVPTGVEVCLSMQHGGPFPSTTDARFGSVGADAIKRFARPLSYQNWPNSLLPDELKNENPLNIWRTVNDEITKE